MKCKTYKDLVNSPLAREDAEVEQVLLELDIVSGGEVKAGDVCKILSLVNNNYHGAADRVECTSEFTVRYSSHQTTPLPTSNLFKAWLARRAQQLVPKMVPSSSVSATPMQAPVPFLTISDLPSLTYPSDTILKNLFKLLFETSEWDKIATSERLKKHVEKLYSKARSSMKLHSKVKGEEWRTFLDRKSEQLLEIWGEMLDKIAEKKNTLESKQLKERKQ